MKCPSCGAAVREVDRFCSECGSALEARGTDAPCRACGQLVPQGAKFCGNCGASEPHAMAAGATGETVVARAPMRPPAEVKPAPAAKPTPTRDAKPTPAHGKPATAETKRPEIDLAKRRAEERSPTTPPPTTTDDEDTGVFRRMIEEELEMTVDLGLDTAARRGSGAPSGVTPDPTQEHVLGKPAGLASPPTSTPAAAASEATATSTAKTKTRKAKPKLTEKAEAVPAGPKRPVGLAKRPKPAATGARGDEGAGTTTSTPAAADEVEVEVDVDDEVEVEVEDDSADIWPDITEEVAEVRFYLLQGLEDDARAALVGLKEKHGHHPELAVIEAEMRGEEPPRSRKKKGAAKKDPELEVKSVGAPAKSDVAKPGRARPQKPPVRTVKSPVVEATASAENEDAPTEPVAAIAVDEEPLPLGEIEISVEVVPTKGETVVSRPEDRLPPAAVELDASTTATGKARVLAKPAPPSRTGVTAPMDKPPTGRGPSGASISKPPPPPPPGTTTPRSTPSVPPLRKPPTREVAITPRSTAKASPSVPPPPMPSVPSPIAKTPAGPEPEPELIDSASTTQTSGEVVPRGDTVVAAYPPEPPPLATESEPVASDELPPGDRTVVTKGPQAPAPFEERRPENVLLGESGLKARNTLVPTSAEPDRPPPPAPFGGEPAPGSTLVPGTTPPLGGFADLAPDPEAAIVQHVEPTKTPAMPMAEPRGGTVPPTNIDREALADELEEALDDIEAEPEPRNETVIAAAPMPPAPFHGEAPVTLAPAQTIRLVMLGSRGQTVAERTIRPGDSLDVGRDPAEPWGDDEYLEERHARISPAVGGGVLVDDYEGAGAVFRQVAERTRIRSGDQVRVGQSLIQYEQADGGGWGRLLVFVNGEEPANEHALGGSGARVGREDGDITFLHDTYVSGEHCRFLCEGNDVFVEDLDSSNGTYVRVRQGEPVELGSLLLLGHTQFRVRPA